MANPWEVKKLPPPPPPPPPPNPWSQKYYDRYVLEAQRLGVTPTYNFETFASKIDQGNFEGSYSNIYKTDLVQQAVAKINASKKQAHDWNPAIPFTAYNGATDIDSLSTAVTNTTAETEANKPKNIDPVTGQIDDTLDPTTGKKKYVFTPSELMKAEEVRLTTEANAPDATRPEYTYNPADSEKYFNAIAKAEQVGTNKAVGAVNEQANFINPYATGSGNQIKAISGMLDRITASQQARAFAQGENAYQRNYTGQYADYEKQQAKKTAARSGLLNLGEYYAKMAGEATDRNEANYWKNVGLANQATLATLEGQAEDKKYQRDMDLLERAAELNKPKEQDWWVPFVSAGVGALAGGAGAGLATGITNKIGGKDWGYNPYKDLLYNKG